MWIERHPWIHRALKLVWKRGGEIWVLQFSRLARSQLRALWASGRGGDIYCAHLTFGRAYLQSGFSLSSFPFCDYQGYSAVISITFHLRFCFCFTSHLKRAVWFLLGAMLSLGHGEERDAGDRCQHVIIYLYVMSPKIFLYGLWA